MRKLLLGAVIGYYLAMAKNIRRFLREHPDDPRSLDFQRRMSTLKRDFAELRYEIKAAWRRIETDQKIKKQFDQIMKHERGE